MRTIVRGLALGSLAVAARVANERRATQRERDLHGQIVLITGGTRGLGLLLAREFVAHGCSVAICARDAGELDRARADLEARGGTVLAVRCDVGIPEDVERLIAQVTERFGRIDVLVNNAGIIQVGPLEAMTLADFEQALDVMYWGVVRPTLAVLPSMRARGSGHIVNVTSIGGKVAVPRLLPYVGAKFAATGFSQGLRAELAGSGVRVTTVVPGLMRTGSYINALFKGRQTREYAWFALGSSLPLVSMDARRAAQQIVTAVRRDEGERTLSLPAVALARINGLAPATTARALNLAHRFLLPPSSAEPAAVTGKSADARLDSSVLRAVTSLGRRAAERLQ